MIMVEMAVLDIGINFWPRILLNMAVLPRMVVMMTVVVMVMTSDSFDVRVIMAIIGVLEGQRNRHILRRKRKKKSHLIVFVMSEPMEKDFQEIEDV